MHPVFCLRRPVFAPIWVKNIHLRWRAAYVHERPVARLRETHPVSLIFIDGIYSQIIFYEALRL